MFAKTFVVILSSESQCGDFFLFWMQGDSNNVVLVDESIDFLKSSLEKTESGLVRIKELQTTGDKERTVPGPTATSSPARNIKGEAALHMLLACKRNVLLFHFFRTGLFSLAAQTQAASEKHLGE